MPSTSVKQAKFMRAVAHSPKFAKKVGVPQSVGKDYEMADKKAKKFGDGGMTKKPKPKMDMPREPITGGPDTVPLTPERKKFLEELRRRQAQAGAPEKPKPAKKPTAYAKGGMIGQPVHAQRKPRPVQATVTPTTTNKPRMPIMKKGGEVMKKSDKAGRALVKKSADTMGRAMMKKNKGGSCYAGGGLVAGHKSADGIAKKGKTKGKMC